MSLVQQGLNHCTNTQFGDSYVVAVTMKKYVIARVKISNKVITRIEAQNMKFQTGNGISDTAPNVI